MITATRRTLPNPDHSISVAANVIQSFFQRSRSKLPKTISAIPIDTVIVVAESDRTKAAPRKTMRAPPTIME